VSGKLGSCMILRKEHILRAFVEMALRRIFGLKAVVIIRR
jgi:hypothetical protein